METRTYDCSAEIQARPKKSRCVEWDKWMQFNAAMVMSKKEVDDIWQKELLPN